MNFICDENGKYIVGPKSKNVKIKYNVVTQMLFVTNTEQIPCVLYEMFLDHWNKPNLGIQQVFRVFLVS
jgi:hypothetical protein